MSRQLVGTVSSFRRLGRPSRLPTLRVGNPGVLRRLLGLFGL